MSCELWNCSGVLHVTHYECFLVTMLPAEKVHENIINFSLINPISHWLCVCVCSCMMYGASGLSLGKPKLGSLLTNIEIPPKCNMQSSCSGIPTFVHILFVLNACEKGVITLTGTACSWLWQLWLLSRFGSPKKKSRHIRLCLIGVNVTDEMTGGINMLCKSTTSSVVVSAASRLFSQGWLEYFETNSFHGNLHQTSLMIQSSVPFSCKHNHSHKKNRHTAL